MLAKCHLKVLHHLSHTHLIALREIFLNIDLTHCLTQKIVRYSHGTFPSWTHLLLTRHLTTEEIEVCSIKFITGITCST